MTPDTDVLIVGAGIHGVGVAWVAARAGHRVTVIERTGVAAGTSSRSSKLIHGGLRYLETMQFRLVRESLAERRWMLATFPDLVEELPMHLPVYRGMQRRPWQVHAGLSLYAALGGGRFRSVTAEDLDGLAMEGLEHVFSYTEARTDDAGLCRRLLEEARAAGAVLHMPAELLDAEVNDHGVVAHFEECGRQRSLTARVLVNAAGPWAPIVATRIRPHPAPPAVELVGGAHIEFDGQLQAGAYYIESPRDGRPVFVLPRGDRTLVGTTETMFRGDPDGIEVTAEERAYLQEAFGHRFPARAGGTPVAAWAGLRVLPAGPERANRRSRETVLQVDDAARPRVLGIYGGKLTTWRPTARRVLARLGPALR